MIDLEYSRERMLGDLDAISGSAARGAIDPSACADLLSPGEAHLVVRGRAPQEFLGGFGAALSARFRDVPRVLLERDLLSPLKKALGNAHKRGNLCSAEKWITVEILVTAAGAFLEVSDEGAGFDVAATLARFRSGQKYFVHSGSGFRRFSKAKSVISFAGEGRTFRLRFLRAAAAAERQVTHKEPGRGAGLLPSRPQ